MKKTYISPAILVVQMHTRQAMLLGSNETFKSSNVSDGDGFVQYGRQGVFSNWGDEY